MEVALETLTQGAESLVGGYPQVTQGATSLLEGRRLWKPARPRFRQEWNLQRPGWPQRGGQ